MPGARDALAAVAKLDGVVQTVLTGTSKPNALLKLRTFGLEGFFDFGIGGYGSESYPKGALVRVVRQRAAEKYEFNRGRARLRLRRRFGAGRRGGPDGRLRLGRRGHRALHHG